MSSSMVIYPRWKMVFTILLCILAVAYAAPNLVDRSVSEKWADEYARWLPVKPVNLGLDLQGGSHLLLKVDLATARRDHYSSLLDGLRDGMLAEKIGYVDLKAGEQDVTFTLRDAADAERLRKIVRDIDSTLVLTITDRDVAVALSEQEMLTLERSVVGQSIEIVRRRVDEAGTREPVIQRSGSDRIVLQLPGVDNPDEIKQLLGKTAKMSFHMVDEAASLSATAIPAPGFMRMPYRGQPGNSVVIERKAALGGDTLVDAQVATDPQDGRPVVSFRFDSVGAKKFGDITRTNIGQQFAVVLDGEVITAPVIQSSILGGRGQISGNFTVPEANQLALLLRAGALPAPLTVLEERTVGPGLGADAIEAGKLAGILGFVLVMLYMWVSYGKFGLMANVTLLLNVAMIFAILSALGATLTLPGIAGIVLTIGMAVDANVLVFERMREESRAGRSPISATDAGYSRAMAAIVDANLTTIIAGLLLFWLGSGPVRGFAVTLTVGVVTSMFAALMITRLMVVVWLRRARPSALGI